MTIDIELLLAWHPLFFLGWKRGVEDFHGGDVLTAIGGSRRDMHPLLTVQHSGDKLAHEKGSRKVAVYHKADVFLLAAHKPTTDVVAGIAEVDVHIVAHLPCNLKGMLDQKLAELLPLVFGCNAKRPEGKDLLAVSAITLKPRLGVHDVADDLAVHLKHKCKLGYEIGVTTHHVNVIVLVRTGLIGGAYSVDKAYSLSRGYGWWADEQPSDEIKRYVERQIKEKDFDVILSHTCPFKYEPIETFLPCIDQITVADSTERWLDMARRVTLG